MSSAPSLTLNAPNPVLVNTAVTISGTIDAADAAAGTQIDVYTGTTLLGSTTANASGVWSLAATVTAGSTDSITARATNAVGQTTTAAVTLHSFAFANAATAAAAQTLASKIDAAAPSTVDVVSISGTATIPGSAAYVVDDAPGATTITSATDPSMFIGTGGATVTFTAATAPATQQQIVVADNSAAASLANLLGDGGAPAGSNEFDFEGVANVAFTGTANNGIEIAAGTLVTGSGADFIVYGGANSGAIEITLKSSLATVVGSDTGANNSAEIVDKGYGNTVFAGLTPTTIMGSSASGNYYLGNLNAKDAYIGGSTPSQGEDTVFVGAYGGAIYGGANAVSVITGSGAVNVSAGGGTMNIYEVGSGAVEAFGGAGSIIEISGSGASSTVVVANAGLEQLNLTDAGAAIVEGGSGTDFVALGSGESYFLAGSGQATIAGGAAPDSYVFVSGNAGRVDTITNFKSSDQIDVGGYTNAWTYIQGHEKVSGGNLTFSLPDGTSVTLDGVTSLNQSQFFDFATAEVKLAGLTGGDAVEGTPIVATASGFGGFGAITYMFTAGSTVLQSGASSSYTPGYGGPAGETITVTASRGSGFAATASAGPLQAADAPGTLTLAGLTGGDAVEGTPIVATIADPNGAPATATYIFKSGSTTLQTGVSNSYTPSYTPSYSSSGEAITVSAVYTDGQGFSDTASASAGTAQDVDRPGTLTLSGLTNGEAIVGTPIVVTISDPDGAPTAATYSFADGSQILQTGSSDSYDPTQSQPNEVIDISASYVDGQGHDDTANTEVAFCFRAGTRIRTPDGEVAVEKLAIGDRVTTLNGPAEPIRWIGRRAYDGRFIAGNPMILPIRIAAGALEPGVPNRDLWVSPGHSLGIDGALVQARLLVNGVSIAQEEAVEQVTYFHIELAEHDIILAEGAPAETFHDEVARAQFQNAAEFCALYPDERSLARPCAPSLWEGFALDAIRRRIDSRAGLNTAAPTDFGPLRGFVDICGPDRVCGWAQDERHPEAPVCLDVWAGGRRVLRLLANRDRADLRDAGLGSGRHAFEADLPEAIEGPIEVRRSIDRASLRFTEAALYDREAPASISCVIGGRGRNIPVLCHHNLENLLAGIS